MAITNVQHRQNKNAKGMTKTYERTKLVPRKAVYSSRHRKEYQDTILRLIVHGTACDTIGSNRFCFKKIKKEHPTDKGYFKEVYILTDMGKKKLNRLKKQAEWRRNPTYLIAIEGNQMLPARIYVNGDTITAKLLWDSSEAHHDEFVAKAIQSFKDKTYTALI